MHARLVVSDSFSTPWTVARHASLFMGFSRQEYWSGLLFSPSGNIPDPGIEPGSLVSPSLQMDLLPFSHWGSHIPLSSPMLSTYCSLKWAPGSKGVTDLRLCFYDILPRRLRDRRLLELMGGRCPCPPLPETESEKIYGCVRAGNRKQLSYFLQFLILEMNSSKSNLEDKPLGYQFWMFDLSWSYYETGKKKNPCFYLIDQFKEQFYQENGWRMVGDRDSS